jgi:hypothetical protein
MGRAEPHARRVSREDHSEALMAFDTSKLRNAVAIAVAGRSGEVRFLGEMDSTAGTHGRPATAMRRWARSAARRLTCFSSASYRRPTMGWASWNSCDRAEWRLMVDLDEKTAARPLTGF